MFRELRKYLGLSGVPGLAITGKGDGSDDDTGATDKDKDKDASKDKDNDKPKDPFSDFDFTRFRSSRPGGTTGGSSSGGSSSGGSSGGPTGRPTPPTGGSSGNNNPFSGFDFSNFTRGTTGGGGTSRPGGTVQINLPRPSRRLIIGFIIAAIVVLFFIFAPNLLNLWTDALWFNEVGQSDLFWTRIWARIAIFAVAAVVAFAVILVNVLIARRFGPTGPVIDASQNPLAALAGGGLRFLNVLFIGGSLIISLILAGILSNAWQTILLFLNAAPWGDSEKIFNQSNGYYVFELPVYNLIRGWATGLLIVSLIAAGLVYALNFALSGRSFALTPAIKVHLSVLGAFILGLFAWGYQLDISNLAYSERGKVVGASATDVGASVPANNILTVIVALSALVLLANIFVRNQRITNRLLVAGFGIWIASSILVGAAFPALYQSFIVRPNELTKETPYIENTIGQTRKAYKLDTIEQLPGSGGGVTPLSQEDITKNPQTKQDVRIWDYDKIEAIYNQVDAYRRYYTFNDVDIDRYPLNAQNPTATGGVTRTTQVVISAREFNPGGLDVAAQTWQSQHLQYTHGYGLQASPINQVDAQGKPVPLIPQSFPISSTGALKVDQPRIYFGNTFTGVSSYAIVNTDLAELDYQSEDQKPITYKYTGAGGIKLDNFFVKAAYSFKLGDFNLLISGSLNDNSKLIIRRNLLERVQLIAPFLQYDSDPYLVVADGRLYWMVDAFTTTDLYPHSQGISVAGTPRNTEFNYIRNSVKVTMDAYNGTLNFYVAENEPIVQTYRKVYPGLFKDLSAMPASLRSHIRYPELLLTVQSQIYNKYHVTDAVQFYNEAELWVIPRDPRSEASTNKAFAPYYLNTQLPGQSQSEFALIQPFSPQGRLNMISWLAARSDGANYGKLVEYRFSGSVNINGPAQFYSLVQSDAEFSRNRSLLNQNGSQLLPGPLLIIPIDKSVLYVLPFYLQAAGNPIPQFNQVAVGTTDNRVVVRPNLDQALTDVFQVAAKPPPVGDTANPPQPGTTTAPAVTQPPTTGVAANPTTPPASGTVAPGGTTPEPASVAAYIKSSQDHLSKAEAARAAGNVTLYQAELKLAQDDLDKLAKLLGTR